MLPKSEFYEAYFAGNMGGWWHGAGGWHCRLLPWSISRAGQLLSCSIWSRLITQLDWWWGMQMLLTGRRDHAVWRKKEQQLQ